MADALERELLQVNQHLLDSIAAGDWETYQDLCDPTLTAFEPEALGHRIEGLEFHRYYFQFGGVKGAHQTTMVDPHVRVVGDVAIVTYVRLSQSLDANRDPQTLAHEETRAWHRIDGKWRHVHFHRSMIPMRWSS